MRRLLTGALAVVLAATAWITLGARERTQAAAADGPMVVHDVYFSLNDNSAEAKQKLVYACKKYLSKHEGTLFFAAGTRAEELKRDINDRDFDVGLHIVFKNMAAHNKYQEAPLHKQFIAENRDTWKKVRVFDTVAEE
jgi:hypothetical protein